MVRSIHYPGVLTRFLPRLASAIACLSIVAGVTSASAAQPTEGTPNMPALTGAALHVETLAKGLDHPWSMAFLPDGRMLIAERSGRLRVLDHGKLAPMAVAGTPQVYVESQAGLFDVALHPDFANNHLIYLSYAVGDASSNALRIMRARLEGDHLADQKVIFEVSPRKNTPVHFGGRITFLADGTFLCTTGDGFDFRERAQKLDTTMGKIVRLKDDGSVPADNPFVGHDGDRPEIWSFGHRNPQGLAYDAVSGRVYEHEHGPRGGDEVNVVERAGNYGWPIATHGLDYSGARISPWRSYPGMRDAIVYWVPSIAPSGLAVYHGALFKGWDGDLLVGALAFKQLRRVHMENGKPVGQQVVLGDMNTRIRDVRVGPDGAIYLTTDDVAGRVLRVTPNP